MTFSEQARARRAEDIRTGAAERARERLAAYDRGLRGTELAEALGVAPTSVRQVLTRARRRLGLPDPRLPVVNVVDCPKCDGSGVIDCATPYCTDPDHGGTCPAREGVGEVPAP